MAGYQTRTKEGGSVVSFAVIGIVLIAVVVGGIYIVQKRGENTKVAGPVSSSPAASPSGKPSTGVPTPPPPSTKPPGVTTTPPPVSTTPHVTSSPNQSIPQTGPEDYMPGGAVFAVLVGMTVAYVNSKRQLRAALSQVD